MALIKCRECLKDVSSSASACPHCGCPDFILSRANVPPKVYPKSGLHSEVKPGVIILLAAAVVGVIVLNLVSGPAQSDRPVVAEAPPPPPDYDTATAKLIGPPPEINTFMGIETQLRNSLRASLRDPGSLEYDGYTKPVPARRHGKTYWMITMSYRARNGFGGMNRGLAIGYYQQGRLIEWENK